MVANMPKQKEPSSQYQAEYNMGMLDYERYHEILKELDVLKYEVLQHKLKFVIPYFSMLHVLFINLKSMMIENTVTDVKNKFKEIKEKINWVKKTIPNPPDDLIDKLTEIHEVLLDIKQKAGLGFPYKKKVSEDQKIKAALGSD